MADFLSNIPKHAQPQLPKDAQGKAKEAAKKFYSFLTKEDAEDAERFRVLGGQNPGDKYFGYNCAFYYGQRTRAINNIQGGGPGDTSHLDGSIKVISQNIIIPAENPYGNSAIQLESEGPQKQGLLFGIIEEDKKEVQDKVKQYRYLLVSAEESMPKDELPYPITREFIVRVLGLVSIQLALTLTGCLLPQYSVGVRNLLNKYPEFTTFGLAMFGMSVFLVFFLNNIANRFPYNYLLLICFTLGLSSLFCSFSLSSTDYFISYIIAMILAMVVGLLVYASQTEDSFDKKKAFFLSVGIQAVMCIIFSIIEGDATFVLVGALTVSLAGYIADNILWLVDAAADELKPGDYIVGSMIIYLDIVNYLLRKAKESWYYVYTVMYYMSCCGLFCAFQLPHPRVFKANKGAIYDDYVKAQKEEEEGQKEN